MPNYDGTGPFGDGRPGRGIGSCGRSDSYRYGQSRGQANRMSYGYRHRHRFIDYVLPVVEEFRNALRLNKTDLKARKEDLESELNRINLELKETESERD